MIAVPQGCSRSRKTNVWGQGAIGGGGLPPLNFSEKSPCTLPSWIPRLRLILLDASIENVPVD